MLGHVTPEELLQVYDVEVRGSFGASLPPGWSGEQDGPVVRALTNGTGFAMLTGTADVGYEELAGLVDRTIAYFRDHGRRFEWKTFDHDPPALRPLLLERGARPEPHETLLLGEATLLAADPVLPDGLTLRSATSRVDLEAVAALQAEVWGDDWAWLADDLASGLEADPPTTVLLVADGDRVVSAAWLTPLTGTSVAGLWGGSTLAAYRGRGIYRALVARRAQLAVGLGYRLLQVDASDDSRPILERLGLVVVGGTTPYVLGEG